MTTPAPAPQTPPPAADPAPPEHPLAAAAVRGTLAGAARAIVSWIIEFATEHLR